jgi:uncharacterized membrane protein YgdD (TMEM256/DUF423 family)
MEKKWVLSGAILAAAAVGLGAFGAHALKDFLAQTGRTEVFQKATEYQFYHALAFLAISKLEAKKSVFFLLLVGTLIFSGSLYALCMTQVKVFGAITPIGGLMMIAGWLTFAFQTYTAKTK